MRFLVETKFTQAPTDEILALIPAEIARGKALDAEEIRLMLYVAADRSGAWQVFQADSPADVQHVIESFPLHPFVTATITPLAEAAEFE
jgi:muconolactone delta-isomerase